MLLASAVVESLAFLVQLKSGTCLKETVRQNNSRLVDEEALDKMV
jgi:hypothetical protein